MYGTEEQLAAPAGSSLVGFVQPSDAAQARTVEQKLCDSRSVTDFGAIGDGFLHTLEEWIGPGKRYADLAALQVDYPFASSSTQAIDSVAFQAAVYDAAGTQATRGKVWVPKGYYVFSESVKVPNFITIEGDSQNGSVISNQTVPLNAPMFIQDGDPLVEPNPVTFISVVFRNLAALGGTHFLKVDVGADGELAGLVLDNISTALQTEGQVEASMLQTTLIRGCNFADGKFAVKCLGVTCNSIHIEGTRSTKHSEAHLQLKAVNGLLWSGGSMEGGAAPGGGGVEDLATIDLLDAVDVSFNGTYFEATHQYLLKTRGNCEAISFDACTIMGAKIGGGPLQAYDFDCEAIPISFGSNHWYQQTEAPNNIIVRGENRRLGGNSNVWTSISQRSGRFTSRAVNVASGARFDLINFSRSLTTPNDTTNQQILTGTLTIDFVGYTGNGVSQYSARTYLVRVSAQGAGGLVIEVTNGLANDDLGVVTMTVQPKSGPTASLAALECVMANVGIAFDSIVQWTFEYQAASTIEASRINVSIG